MVSVLSILVFLYLIEVKPLVTLSPKGPAVEYLYGKVNGVLVKLPIVQHRGEFPPVEAFFGLEYSSIRAGEFRFMPPGVVLDKLDFHPRHVDTLRSPCPQKKFLASTVYRDLPDRIKTKYHKMNRFVKWTSEECLSLNLYRPSRLDRNDTTPFPVMVFVHGESYDMGTGNAYDGSVLASFGRVIVVTVNYRLGVLGFLSTGDRDANGNQALLDLLAVLTWIKENIAAFDGDPGRVTLFGHGHGAALVNFLMLNRVITVGPNGNNLFQRAILQSGSAYSSWATAIDPVTCAQKLAANVNCSDYINKSEELIQCFKNRTADELVENAPLPPKYFSCFAPTLNNAAFFPENSIGELIKRRSGSFTNINVMLGVNKNEAHSFLKQKELEDGVSYFRKSQILRTYVQNVYKYNRQKIFEILDHQYSEWDRMQDDTTRRDNIMELLNDGQYAAPLVKMAQDHSRYADTYLYSFGYSTESENMDPSEWSRGINGDELPYIFGAPLVEGVSPFSLKFKKYDRELSAFMMRMWTNFAKSGNPNYPMKTSYFEGTWYNGINWPKYNLDKQLYLQIGSSTLSRDHYRGKQIVLWLDLIPKIDTEDSKHVRKPNSAEHNLFDPQNISTFDEPSRLINYFRRIGPPLVFTPYMTPAQNDGNRSPPDRGTKSNNSLTNPPLFHLKNNTGDDGRELSSAIPFSHSQDADTGGDNSIPLSITIAIGCTLLFLNILVFAGVYFQREKIKRLKKGQNNQESANAAQESPKDKKDKGEMNHKSTSLTSGRENQSSSSKILNTMETTHANAICTLKSKSSYPPDKYSYSPVPSHSSSPLHRQENHQHIKSNSARSSNISASYRGRPPDIHDKYVSNKPDIKSDKSKRESHSSNNATTIV